MNLKLSKVEKSELTKVLSPKILRNIDDVDLEVLNRIHKRLIDDDSIKLYVDGAANLQSKIAGIGGVFYRNGNELYSFTEFIGSATNNEAEYGALIKGLDVSINLNLLDIEVFADSELVVRQINGQYKVKNERMQKLHSKVMVLLREFNSWTVSHIPREKNIVADKLSKEGMGKGK